MSLFKNLGASLASDEELSQEIQDEVANLLLNSWAMVPADWQASATQEQVADYLEGVVGQAIRLFPTAPQRELILYCLNFASSNWAGGGGGGGGGTPPAIVISPDVGNQLSMRLNGLYAAAGSAEANWNSKEW